MVEIWKAIPDFSGYDVSNQGRVRSYWRKVALGFGKGTKTVLEDKPQRLLKPGVDQHGYPFVNLFQDGKGYTRNIHRLVLMAFIGPCPPRYEACHNDGIRTHNIICNLRWDTRSNNHLDKRKHDTTRMGERCNLSRFTAVQVLQVCELHGQGGHSFRVLGRIFNISPGHAWRIVNRKQWIHLHHLP